MSVMSTFEDYFLNDASTISDYPFGFDGNLGRILTDLDMIKRNQSDFQTGYEEQKQSIRNLESAVQILRDGFQVFYEEQKQKDQRILSLLEQLVTQKNTKITQEKLPRLSNQLKANSGKISIAQWCCEPNVGATDNTAALITSTSHVSPSSSSIIQIPSSSMDYELSQQTQPINTDRKISFLHPFDGQLSAQTDRGTLLKDTNGQPPVLVLKDCHFPADTQIEIAAVSRSENGEFLSPFQFHDKNDGYKRFEYRAIGFINADYQQIKLENLKLYKLVNNDMKDDGRFTVRSYPSDAVIKTWISSPKDLNEQYKFDQLQIAVRFRRGDEILSQGILYSNPLIKGKTKLFNPYQLSITPLDITNDLISFNSNHQAQMKFHVEIPHEFHCTIDSGSKYLHTSIVTNDQPSLIYSISPSVIPIQKQSFEMTLIIHKQFFDTELLDSISKIPGFERFNIKMQIFHQDTLHSNEMTSYDTCPAWTSVEFTENDSFYSNLVTQNSQKRTYDQIDDLR